MSKRSVERLSQYRTALVRYKELGFSRIYSSCLAEAIGATAVQVRKDFSMFRINGNKRGGYGVDEILERLNRILCKNRTEKVVIVGAGNIGCALVKYKGFESGGIRIVACFDIDPAKYRKIGAVPVLPFDDFRVFVRENEVRIAILCVPAYAAQHVADNMVSAGITGILNFASMRLVVPPRCVVNNVHLEQEIENLIYYASLGAGKGRKA